MEESMKQLILCMVVLLGVGLGACHEKTIGYLITENASYDPEKLLEALPAGKMLLERCIVLSRLHEHEQALTILLYSLRNVETAFQYCADVCELPDSRDNRVYHALVHV